MALKKADVILYDALASVELLKHARNDFKLLNVGKRKVNHSFSQDEIHQLIAFYSGRYNYVVRLKGGDPYVFGRGHEELEYAHKRGIDVEIIPGISSAIAAPSNIGIPLTKRGVNESFWVITGTCSSGKVSNDISLAAQSSATVVVLMGMAHLPKIISSFIETRGESEPAAIIQNATLANQKFIIGTVSTIATLATLNDISSHAIIVIGDVVRETQVMEVIKDDKIYSMR
jgi:uroporphyrin-III C-methyltransferase